MCQVLPLAHLYLLIPSVALEATLLQNDLNRMFRSVISIVLPFVSFLVFATCKQKIDTSAKPEVVWTHSPLNGDRFLSIYPVTYKGQFIATSLTANKNVVMASSFLENGTVNWVYSDSSGILNALYYNLKPYQNGKYLIIPNGNKLSCFDLHSGQLVWANSHYNTAENFLEGEENNLYRTYYEQGKAIIARINVQSGALSVVHVLEIPKGFKCYFRSPVPIIEEQMNDTILLTTSIQMSLADNHTTAKVHAWSLHQKQWLFESTIFPDNNAGLGVTKQPLLVGDKVLFVAYKDLICMSTKNGEIVWRVQMSSDMLSSTPLVVGNKIFCALENGRLCAFSLADGSEIWNAQCSGTPSRISTGDGVLFVVGGGDGILYAYDQENGGVLWTMKSTELPKADKQGWFQRTFLFVEQQNRLMVTDGRNWWGLSFSNGVFTQ